MSGSVCLGQTVASAGADFRHNASCSRGVSSCGGVSRVSLGRVGVGGSAGQLGGRKELLGSGVGARGAHVGRGLGLGHGVSNGSRWSAGTWLDNK